MKKVAFILLSSFLLLGACSHDKDSVEPVKKSTHKKDNPKAHKDKGETGRTEGKKINNN
ncbi:MULTISPECIES: hypothetical protein [Staphylococcus]|uniref:hypothetical protein n=1 Tax=Staphylococcus TaxID=1279 RepID=UPI000DFF1E58|nr:MULTISPECIES: hypothetical protein [Staphylococcus]MBI5971847.1 hypothetical protein [Staphylococcus caledonicus]MCE5091313.1 hypothetical protein [Staphylococcus devriesei]MCE5096605.1 hypothetical protein [Staphylococcus devriesei]MCI2948087.1 hypothetical protein [Staphylococcus sp. acrmy]WKU12947.1 hypothetical protein Q2T90_09355 [Staphylococcus devriesei]